MVVILTFREYRRHCVLSGGAQRRTLPRCESEEIKILNISVPWVEIGKTTSRVAYYNRTLVTPARIASEKKYWLVLSIFLVNNQILMERRKLWSRWSKWGGCSVTCGDGTISRRRLCVSGRCVPGELEEQRRPCNRPPCNTLSDIFDGSHEWTILGNF